MDYSLRQLQSMISVARHGSYSRAAQELHTSRSNLSLTIKDLESQLGFEVFLRTTRFVELTAAGKAFLPHAERVLDEYQSSLWAARNVSRQGQGRVKVASSQLMAATLLPVVLQEFALRYPGIDVQLLDVAFEKVADAVALGQAEIGIGPERPLPPSLSGSLLTGFPLMCLCSPQHAFAELEQVTWEAFSREKIITVDRQTLMMIMRDIAYSSHLAPTWEVNHLLTSLALVANNFGVMPCTSHVAPLLAIYGVRMVPLVEPTISRQLILMTRATHRLSAPAEAFAGVVREMLPRLGKPWQPQAQESAHSASRGAAHVRGDDVPRKPGASRRRAPG